jgi:hypothetical protein
MRLAPVKIKEREDGGQAEAYLAAIVASSDDGIVSLSQFITKHLVTLCRWVKINCF